MDSRVECQVVSRNTVLEVACSSATKTKPWVSTTSPCPTLALDLASIQISIANRLEVTLGQRLQLDLELDSGRGNGASDPGAHLMTTPTTAQQE